MDFLFQSCDNKYVYNCHHTFILVEAFDTIEKGLEVDCTGPTCIGDEWEAMLHLQFRMRW